MDVDIKKVDKSQVKAFLMFDLLILPLLVKIGFIVGAVLILLSGISMPFQMGMGFGGFSITRFVIGIVAGVIMIAVGLVWLRITCESMIIVFKIHEALVPKKPEEPKAAAPEPAAAKPAEPPKADAPSATS
jgi:hypothetical protein